MIILVLIIAVVNLAMGFALAMYFDPARGTRTEIVTHPAPPPTPETADPTEQAEAADELVDESEPLEVNEPVDESEPLEGSEPPEEAVPEEDIDHAPPIKSPSLRNTASCEPLIDEMREHIAVYRGLLCDLEGQLRKTGDSIEATDVVKFSADLIAYNSEINGHLDQTLDGFESQRDAWEDAEHAISQLLTDLRANRRHAAATDQELDEFDSADAAESAQQRLRTLLTTCLDRSFELRDHVESARSEILFDFGLLDDLAPNELLSSHEGVLNRLGIEANIRTWRQNESNSTRPYSLAVICIDGLSEFNSTLGTVTVDLIMGHVADVALDAIRSSDFLGQYDGSKCLLFFPETGPASATGYLEQIRQTLEAIRFEHEGTSLNVTVSCGVVEGDPDDAIDALAISAIETMDAARNTGGNCTLVLEQGEPTQITPPDYGAEPRTIAI